MVIYGVNILHLYMKIYTHTAVFYLLEFIFFLLVSQLNTLNLTPYIHTHIYPSAYLLTSFC